MTTQRIEEMVNGYTKEAMLFKVGEGEMERHQRLQNYVVEALTQAHQAGIRDAVVIVESKRLNGSEDGSKFGHYGWEAYNQALDDTIKALTDNKKEYDKNLPPTILPKASERPTY